LIDNKHVATGGLLTDRQAYCLALALDSWSSRKSFHWLEKTVQEQTPAGPDDELKLNALSTARKVSFYLNLPTDLCDGSLTLL